MKSIGDGRWIRCAVNPEDFLTVQAVEGNDGRNGVAICIETKDEHVSIVLTSHGARALAAGILNEADLSDGTEPLVFYPPGLPDGEDPFDGKAVV